MTDPKKEARKKELLSELENEIEERARGVLRELLAKITGDPRIIMASILGLDAVKLIKKTIDKELDEYTKEG